ncbi:MAG: HEAT repeat domain-containing protein, partial [Planctomycetota bacterium]|nr:HEAT repeat domain-containing protein [Planctomycetota bacterium]
MALKLIGPKAKSSIPALVKMLGDKDGTLRVNAIYAVSAVGEAAIPALTGALSSRNVNQRMNSIYALGNLGPRAKSALPTINKYAKDREAGVRKAVAWAQAKINAGAKPPVGSPATPQPGPKTPATGIDDLVARLFGRNYGKQKAAEKELRSLDSRQTLPAIIKYICALNKRAQSTQITYIARQLSGMGPRAVPGLVKTLESENQAERDLALRLMSSRKLQPYAAPELQKLLAHEKYGTRVTALEALSRMGAAAKPSIPAMVACLSDKDWRVTRAAVKALGKLEKYSLDEMKKILSSEDNKLRALALEVLMRMRSASSLTAEHAVALINHDDFPLRRAAAKALCWTRPTLKKEQIATFNNNAVLVLSAELRNRVDNAASYAARILGDLGPKAKGATPALAGLFKNKKKSPRLRASAANALADIGVAVEDCVVALGEAMLDKDPLLSLCAGRALTAFKEKSFPALPNILKAMRGKDGDTRTRAHQAAGAIGVKAVPELIKGLGDEDEKYRFNCAYALGIVGSPAISQLVPECSSKDWKRRETAVCALGEMAKAASGQVKIMIQCLGDSAWQVQKSAG